MDHDSAQPGSNKKILATDLDGTLIPLPGNENNSSDLITLTELIQEHRATLVFVTGRHLDSVTSAISEYGLPQPDWIICDVGTSIYRNCGGRAAVVADYQACLRQRLNRSSFREFHRHFSGSAIVELQQAEKQGDFKMSFYADRQKLDEAIAWLSGELQKLQIDGTIIASVDPFNGDGLLDVLPRGVSKAFALDWWAKHNQVDPRETVFAGDSGNDLAAMTAGYKTIVVGNAEPDLIDAVRQFHHQNQWTNRLHVASRKGTSGVLEGCHSFDVF